MDPTTSGYSGTTGNIVVTTWEPAGEATALVLLAHGYGEHVRRYDHVAAALTAAGFIVVGPDHVGHGASDGERASITSLDDLVDDLRGVALAATAAHPDLPVALIGHSMGGLIATVYAQRYPGELAALVLSGPFLGNPLIAMLLELDPIPELPIDPATLSRDPAVGEAYAADPLVYHGAFRRETLLAMLGAADSVADGTLGDQPTLWVHGTDDQLAPYEVAKPVVEAIAGERLVAIAYEGAAHEVFNEINRDEVIAEVVSFIASAVAD